MAGTILFLSDGCARFMLSVLWHVLEDSSSSDDSHPSYHITMQYCFLHNMHEHVHSISVLPYGLFGAHARGHLSSGPRVENCDFTPSALDPVANPIHHHVVCSTGLCLGEEDRIGTILRSAGVLHGIYIPCNICNSSDTVLHARYQQMELLQESMVQCL